ncbi:carboxylesterase family protein [Aquimarina sp. TRL1]|uniref:carboxylesterase family protein n=1 Tax=Aquimarina sp. (strain TRL1) TaxID=2736252 RepID=UPI0020CAD1A9|nr:carboxylesterase family protein [Aquimarina sp. TRL1]
MFTACSKNESITPDNGTPVIQAESSYTVLKDENITYAEGLSHNMTSTSSFATPLKLDVYYPDNNSTNRPIYMFIHGGGFTGGTKTKPEIVDMANFYASRGWVFASIDYRTVEELGTIQGMTPEQLYTYYSGIAPQEWIENALQGSQSADEVQQATAMYLAQRDAKAALRWIVANASTYSINKDFITVGGASAGAITTIALGISNQEDFRNEITISDDPTLSTTNLNESYIVRSMVYFWGSNIKLDVFEAVYNLEQYDRYDASDPELFMGHGTAQDLVTPYEEALELQSIYNSLGIYNKLATLTLPNGNPAGHGAWNGVVNGKGLSELTFDFLVERQNLNVE